MKRRYHRTNVASECQQRYAHKQHAVVRGGSTVERAVERVGRHGIVEAKAQPAHEVLHNRHVPPEAEGGGGVGR